MVVRAWYAVTIAAAGLALSAWAAPTASADVSPFDTSDPTVGRLDPALLQAIQEAARAASQDGVDMRINSGWRTREFQMQLFDEAVQQYGSADIARQYVASPDVSNHVVGKAVDVGPTAADTWLAHNGTRFGLCQTYANEVWHFELAADEFGNCPPMKPNAAG